MVDRFLQAFPLNLHIYHHYLLVNIATADVICLVFLPFMMIEKHLSYQGLLSDIICKFIVSFHVPLTASFASILTLVVLSVERYHAIVKPMNTGIRLREDTVKYAIISVWITAILATLPTYIFSFYHNTERCEYNLQNEYQKIYLTILLFLVVFFPFIIISFCYFQIVREMYFKNKVAPQNVPSADDVHTKRKLVKFFLSITSLMSFHHLFLSNGHNIDHWEALWRVCWQDVCLHGLCICSGVGFKPFSVYLSKHQFSSGFQRID